MHDRNGNNKDGGHGGMIWMMIPCLLLFGFLFLGGDKLSSAGGYLWPILIGIFVVAHVWMMLRGHAGHGGVNVEDKTGSVSAQEPATKDDDSKHKHSGGCH
jgi:hypothetical protein